MKAFQIKKYDKKESLEFADVTVPNPGDNEVLIQIHACGVNLLDAKIKSGEFKIILPYQLPLTLGHDAAGIVTQVGKNVKLFNVGDQVYTRPADFHIGTFAEYITVQESDVALKPENISMEEASSIPLVALTAWQALVEIGNLQRGQKVFIQAGSGGVGTIAIQLAKHLGATVATTASEKSFRQLRELGADVLIDYKKDDFENVLRDYDLVLNSQDTDTLTKSINVLKPGGKLISISGPPTPDFARKDGLPWYVKLIMSMLSFNVRRKAEKRGISYAFLFMRADGQQLQEITKLIESGVIRPVVDKVFPFADTNDALAYVEGGRAKGKVVVKIR